MSGCQLCDAVAFGGVACADGSAHDGEILCAGVCGAGVDETVPADESIRWEFVLGADHGADFCESAGVEEGVKSLAGGEFVAGVHVFFHPLWSAHGSGAAAALL